MCTKNYADCKNCLNYVYSNGCSNPSGYNPETECCSNFLRDNTKNKIEAMNNTIKNDGIIIGVKTISVGTLKIIKHNNITWIEREVPSDEGELFSPYVEMPWFENYSVTMY